MIQRILRKVELFLAAILVVAIAGHFMAGKVIAGVPERLDAIQSSVNNVQSTADSIETKTDDLQNTANSIETKTDNLQNTANSTQGTVNGIDIKANRIESKVDDLQNTVNDVQSTVNDIETKVDEVENKLDHSSRLAIVKTRFTTLPSSTTVHNIDGAGALPFLKIKRYTLTIHPSLLGSVPSGTDTIELRVGVLDDTTAFDVIVFSQDTAAISGGTTVPPYTGTNSFIRIVRGDDGLGSVDVRVNAYVELEP